MAGQTNLKTYDVIIALYTELYKQATVKSSLHNYIPATKSKILICKFIAWLQAKYKKQLGVDFLINYFEFQFNRYIGVKNSKYGLNAVVINWLVGPKAIAAWEQRNVNKKKFIKYRISKRTSIQLKKAFAGQNKIAVNKQRVVMFLRVNKIEEVEKARYYNTELGYLYCGSMTTLFNPNSNYCRGCVFMETCAERLKQTFFAVYKIRTNNH